MYTVTVSITRDSKRLMKSPSQHSWGFLCSVKHKYRQKIASIEKLCNSKGVLLTPHTMFTRAKAAYDYHREVRINAGDLILIILSGLLGATVIISLFGL